MTPSIHSALSRVFGGDEAKIRAWWTSYNYHLEGTPDELAKTEEGTARVDAYLGEIENGLDGGGE